MYVALSVEKLTIDYKLMLADSNMSYDMFGFWWYIESYICIVLFFIFLIVALEATVHRFLFSYYTQFKYYYLTHFFSLMLY